MKINLDDPNLTAYALGELKEPEQSLIAKTVEDSPEAQAFVRETQQLARLLRGEFAEELKRATGKRRKILSLPETRSFWSDARWMSIGVAALLAVCAVVAAVALSGNRFGPFTAADNRESTPLPHSTPAPEVDVQMDVPSESPLVASKEKPAASEFPEEKQPAAAERAVPDRLSNAFMARRNFNTAEYGLFEENPFLAAASNPLSTVAIDVDTSSYANVRRFLNSGALPPKDAVRIDEMVNYFTYDYPEPNGGEPFSINLDVAGCPWQSEHRLVRIGLRGRDPAVDSRSASNLVFLLDFSGLMEPGDGLPRIKQSVRSLIDKLTEKDRVAIVAYANGWGLALPSTTGEQKEKINQALEKLVAGGSPNVASGVELAYRVASDNFVKDGINRVILATDGDFDAGVTGERDLVQLAKDNARDGIFLTVLGMGNDNLKDSAMRKIADKANGNYVHVDSLSETRKVLVQQMNGTLVTIAKDVNIEVEFNPARVTSYRLLGYEKPMLRDEYLNNDIVDAGEIGAGHTVTALYEVVPAGNELDGAASGPALDSLKYQPSNPAAVVSTRVNPQIATQMLTLKLRHNEPAGNRSNLAELTLTDEGAGFEQASADFRFAAAVAEFGMILRGSPHKGSGTMDAVLDWARQARGADEAGYRAGFVELVEKARSLSKG